MTERDDKHAGATEEFRLPSETYNQMTRQFEDWLAANGYPAQKESALADISFRTRSRRLLYLLKYVSAVLDSERLD